MLKALLGVSYRLLSSLEEFKKHDTHDYKVQPTQNESDPGPGEIFLSPKMMTEQLYMYVNIYIYICI